jgi:hypothetical protein
MADVLKVKGFHRVNTASGERIAYANVLLACWNGPITLQFPVPDAATEHQLLESTRARLIDLFREAMAQLERGPIPFP